MQVVVAVPPPSPPSTMDFNFDSNCSSPYMTAPSSPQRFGNLFCSAPTSPTRTLNSSFFNPRHSSASSVPEPNDNDPNQDDFQFHFNAHLQKPSLSADELFQGGKIRPLKPPSFVSKGVVEETTGDTSKRVEEPPPPTPPQQQPQQHQQHKLGRERASSFSIPSTTTTSFSGSRGSRSNSSVCEFDNINVSPQRVNTKTSETASSTSSSSSIVPLISFTKGYRKWRIKDFLLFRSASEGRATGKDPLRKFSVLSKTTAYEDVKNLSFRSTETSGSMSRRRGAVSAHELHYTVNRAASEELKKKTLLPYKQGLLGCLGFNPGMHHINRRIGSMERS